MNDRPQDLRRPGIERPAEGGRAAHPESGAHRLPQAGSGDIGRRPDDRPQATPTERIDGSAPSRVGEYEIVGRLPGGGMADLFLAYKRSRYGLVRRAVIKRVKRSRPGFKQLQRMLLDEARALAHLEHPNLVSILDVGEDEHGVYLALEHIEGTDLRQVNGRLRTRKEALPFELGCYVTIEVLRGLQHAHSAMGPDGIAMNILHRDVNPSNVLISVTGHIKLTDFGVVHMRERIQETTEAGLVKGKFAYISPEYVAGEPSSMAGDIYAAGVMLFELLTGRECFSGSTPYEVMWKVVNRGIPIRRLEREGVPEELCRIVQRATSPAPERRHATAQEMANALEGWLMRSNKHATPWVLATFFARHDLFPDRGGIPVPGLDDIEAGEIDTAPGTDRQPLPARESAKSGAPGAEPQPRHAEASSWARQIDSAFSVPALETRSPAFFESPSDDIIDIDSLSGPPPPEPPPPPTPPPPLAPSARTPRPRSASASSSSPPLRSTSSAGRTPLPRFVSTSPSLTGAATGPVTAPTLASRGAIAPLAAAPVLPLTAPWEGKLEDTSAAKVLRELASSRSSGSLEFRCGLIWKRVHFDEGAPVGITSNMGMELIGEHLVKARLIERGDLDRALHAAERDGDPVTLKFLELGLVDQVALEEELGKNLAGRLTEVLEWRWGLFAFAPGPPEPSAIRPRLDLGALITASARAHEDASDPGAGERDETGADSGSRIRQAVQRARSIAESSGKGRIEQTLPADSPKPKGRP